MFPAIIALFLQTPALLAQTFGELCMASRFLFQILLLFLLGQSVAAAQSVAFTKDAVPRREAGLPFIQNFRPKDYQALPQNWAIVQDRRGVMYFGNSAGVLEYDGSTWRTIPLPGLSEAYSLALDEHGKIFVGGNNELGYLASDSLGQMRYVSLLEYVPAPNREFGQVWKTLVTSEGIFFETTKGALRLQRTPANTSSSPNVWTAKIWKPVASYYRIHSVHGRIFFALPKELLGLRGDSLHLVLNHAETTTTAISLMLPYSEESALHEQQKTFMLIGTRSQGLFLYDGVSLRPFKSEAEDYLRENQLYRGALLPDGRYAFATLWGGVVIIDRQGRLLQIVNKAAGLHNENILFVFPDREGGLWLGTDSGIARIEVSTPLSLFQESLGLTVSAYCITRHRNRLYIGTSSGLAYLAEAASPGVAPVLKFMPEIKSQTRVLLSIGPSLLVGGSDGIYQLDENGDRFAIDKRNPGVFYRSAKDPRRIYVGLMDGLAVLLNLEGKLQLLQQVPGIVGEVKFIIEDTTGALWVGMFPQGLLRVELPAGEPTPAIAAEIKIERFGPANGLPEGWTAPYYFHDRIVFSTPKGLRRFDAVRRTFAVDSSFGAFFADTNRTFYSLTEDFQKQVWMVHSYQGRDEAGVTVPGKGGAYDWVRTPFSRIGEFGYMDKIYADPDQPGVIWFDCEEALVRYDPASPHAAAVDFRTLVRRVTMKGDSVIYGGADSRLETVLSYANNALRFEYAAPTFDNSAATRYQYYLEGFEENWSAWTAETKKEYTNLPEGKYRFQVRAKNVYDRLGNDGVFVFTIRPPWYRTWWAYSIYLLLAGVSVFSLVRWRVQALQQKARQLEATIAERTAQVVAQKNRLEEQSHQLQEMDRVKSRFFANLSHEFRTPLTLILGPLEKVLRGVEKNNSLDDTRMMHRNAANLLRLVNQLLDLAKLESGKLRLQASAGDLIACVRSCLASFDSLAKTKKITLHFHAPTSSLEAWFNRSQLEEVFYNLLSNAFKFTPEGGEVSVQLSVASNQLSVASNQLAVTSVQLSEVGDQLTENQLITDHRLLITDNWTLITVKDTGIGIPADKLPHVFDRFYQADPSTGSGQSSVRKFEGTGIGLSLVKELVELHYGKVEIRSAEGKGTEVVVLLPLGREHLKAEEIQSSVISDQYSVISDASIEDRESMIEDQEVQQSNNSAIQPSDNDTIILVVEDNADMRAYIRRELEPDYKVVEAPDGQEGMEKALEIIPDLVISDVMMPVMDGYALCDRLKSDEKTCHIPVILLTAKAEREDKLEGLETGADDYLTKPFDAVELQVRIKNLIALRRKLQEKFKMQALLRPSEINITSRDEAFLKKAVAAVEEHLEDESFSPEDLSREVNMSRAQFYRKLRALTGQPAGHFIRSIRLQRAADLLKQGFGNVTEIAYKVGFSSQAYFSKCFQEYFGVTPKEYKLLNG